MSDFYNKYPYTDFHELNLDWVIERVKKLTEDWLATQQEWNDTEEQWQQLHDYVMNYFANLDVSQEINDKIDAMVADGTFLNVIRSTVEAQTTTATENWLAAHIVQPTTPVVDNTLSIAGAAADSKTVGDKAMLLLGRFINSTQAGTYVDFNNLPEGSIAAYSYAGTFSNAPTVGFQGSVVTFGGEKGTSQFMGQLAFPYNERNTFYFRTKYTTWGSWGKVANENSVLRNLGYFNTEASAASYLNLNDLPFATMITYGFSSANMLNIPRAGFSGNVITFGGLDAAFEAQIAFDPLSSGHIYFRTKYSTWGAWNNIYMPDLTVYVKQLGHFGSYADASSAGYGSMDDLPIGSVISYGFTTSSVTGTPSADFDGVVLTLGGHRGTANFNSQIAYYSRQKKVAVRTRWATWGSWFFLEEGDTFRDKNAYRALGDFVACGDSLTASLSYKSAGISATVKSWAAYLAEACNSNTLIKASGGLTTAAYLASSLYTDAVSDTKDYAVIFLGTNDLNSSVDIPTFTQNYTDIINGLLTNHKFVLCISLIDQVSAAGRENYNSAIESICSNTANAFYVNANKYNSILTGYTNWGHCSSFGYAVLAHMIELAINDTIAANSTYFNYTLDFI